MRNIIILKIKRMINIRQIIEEFEKRNCNEDQIFLKENDEDVLRTNSNEVAIPCVDEEGNEKFVVFVVKVPTGSRDGEEYDGYAVAESYALKLKEKAEKAEKKKKEKES